MSEYYDETGEDKTLEAMERGIVICEYMNMGLTLDEASDKWRKYKNEL
jgi:hypothetical protein